MDLSDTQAVKDQLRTSDVRQLQAIFDEIAWTGAYDTIIDLITSTDDIELIENVAKLDHRGVHKAVASAKHASAKVLREMFEANDEDEAIQWFVLRNPNAPADLLEAEAGTRYWDWDLDVAIAGNPSTPPKVLRRLSKDENWRVKEAVALNPSTDYKTLESMQNDDSQAQWALAKNPHTPLHLLKAWTRSEEINLYPHARRTLAKVLKEELDAKAKAEGLEHLSTATKLSIFDFGKWNWVILQYSESSEE